VIFYVQYWLKKTLITHKNIYLNNQEDSLQKLSCDKAHHGFPINKTCIGRALSMKHHSQVAAKLLGGSRYFKILFQNCPMLIKT
jgi:hypothetical protein